MTIWYFGGSLLAGALLGFIYRTLHRRFGHASPAVRMGKNIGRADRVVRLVIAAIFLIYSWYSSSAGALVFSGFCFFEATFSWCGFYAAIGKNTCPLK